MTSTAAAVTTRRPMIRRSRAQIHPYRVLFWSVAAIAGVLFLLDRHPFVLDAGDPELAGRSAAWDARGDILVVLSEEGIVAARAAGQWEGSWAWVDLVGQEVGPVATSDLSALDGERLQAFSTVIFTGSAAAHPAAAELVDELQAFASHGGVLALELPAGPLRSAFAADGQGGWRAPGRVTAVEGVDDATRDHLLRMPLMTRFMGSTRPPGDSETLLAMDGAPVVYTRRIGDGEVIIFDFDVGAQLTALQQGLPGPEGRVRPRRPGSPLRTFDLVASSELMSATVPYADVLEAWITHAVLGHRYPVFALWPFPNAARGALLVSHDARSIDGRPLWMSIHERSHDARTSTFLAAPSATPPDGFVPDDAEHIGHAALLWVLDPDDAGLRRRYGLLGIDPVVRPLTLVGQLEHLEAWLGDDADIRGVRVWDGRWTEDPTQPWRIMDAVELRYSVSYGPARGGPAGWLFGSCQPFTPLDSNGLPFRVQEVPACFVDPTSEDDLALMAEVLQSAAEHAWAVHLVTAADRFRDEPDMEGFDAWSGALRFAQRNDMWIGGAGELVRFRRERSGAELRVIGREVTRRDADGVPMAIEYTVEAETSTRGLALVVPESFGGLTLERVTRGARQAQLSALADRVDTDTTTYVGRVLHIINLNPGFTTVGLRYER